MNQNPETNLLDIPAPQMVYANLGTRFGATLIDGLLLSFLVLPLTYFNMTDWKNPALFAIVSLVSMSYKPFCEFQYGATIGKKALKIKVVNYQHEKANLMEILLRNSITIGVALVSLFLTLSIFSLPGFENVKGYTDYLGFMSQVQSINWVSWLSWVYYIADVIFLLTDEKKRTLHDRIGGTYVIHSTE